MEKCIMVAGYLRLLSDTTFLGLVAPVRLLHTASSPAQGLSMASGHGLSCKGDAKATRSGTDGTRDAA